jgi:hypothetical protein
VSGETQRDRIFTVFAFVALLVFRMRGSGEKQFTAKMAPCVWTRGRKYGVQSPFIINKPLYRSSTHIFLNAKCRALKISLKQSSHPDPDTGDNESGVRLTSVQRTRHTSARLLLSRRQDVGQFHTQTSPRGGWRETVH